MGVLEASSVTTSFVLAPFLKPPRCHISAFAILATFWFMLLLKHFLLNLVSSESMIDSTPLWSPNSQKASEETCINLGCFEYESSSKHSHKLQEVVQEKSTLHARKWVQNILQHNFCCFLEVSLSTPRHPGPSITEQAGPAACSINYVPGDLWLHIYGGETGMQLPMVTNRPIVKLSYIVITYFFFPPLQWRIFFSPCCTDRWLMQF